MLLRRIAIENVRSFLDRQEVQFDGPITIVIGPNGGGKTNLLDTVVIMLRRYIFATRYFIIQNINGIEYHNLEPNPNLHQLSLAKHSTAIGAAQYVEIEIEVSATDKANMAQIKRDAKPLVARMGKRMNHNPWDVSGSWDLDAISPGDRFTYIWRSDQLEPARSKPAVEFLQYLQLFEIDNTARSELKMASLQMPMVYLPVNRAGGQFQSSIQLANHNDVDFKKGSDATSSRTGTSIIQLAVGRLAAKYRLLLEGDNQNALTAFNSDENIQRLTADLLELGYKWHIEAINPLANLYDIALEKQGSKFLVSEASSGEKELLTYLFAVHALNVRDAVIIVDEPELHLHPRWQRSLYRLFERISSTTGNQFIIATHSPTFVSPKSIQYVTRVYSEAQQSRVIRLNAAGLPNAKHLFNVVNSQNNESIFFSDRVILVEGISDKIFFDKVFRHLRPGMPAATETVEIVSVGGKGLFEPYKRLLDTCHVPSAVIADLDYIEQTGTPEIKKLFVMDAGEIITDVLLNVKSKDGSALIDAIDRAIISGSWDLAASTWRYIKSRRVKLKHELDTEEKSALNSFLDEREKQNIFILRLGALEDYLPSGFKGKDVEKLITFLESENFWDELPVPAKTQLTKITDALFPLPAASRDA